MASTGHIYNDGMEQYSSGHLPEINSSLQRPSRGLMGSAPWMQLTPEQSRYESLIRNLKNEVLSTKNRADVELRVRKRRMMTHHLGFAAPGVHVFACMQ